MFEVCRQTVQQQAYHKTTKYPMNVSFPGWPLSRILLRMFTYFLPGVVDVSVPPNQGVF
jgi:hypothetical protein